LAPRKHIQRLNSRQQIDRRIQPQPNARRLISIATNKCRAAKATAGRSAQLAGDASALFHGRPEKKSLNIRAVEHPSLVAGPVFKTGEGR